MHQKYQPYSLTEWQQIMTDYATSGLTQKAFCQRAGLAMSTFSKWRKQLGLVGTEAQAEADSHADFKPLLLTSLAGDTGSSPASTDRCLDWDVELVLGRGITLRLRIAA